MIYLLDTNACIQYLRNRQALVVQRIQQRSPADLRLCSVVLSELYYGCLRSSKPAANRASVDAFAQPYSILPFDESAADKHATSRRGLESLGMPIGPYDSQIAAIALAPSATLVTHNTAEFGRVAGLSIEDWELP
jgi:tRNA(fMet)-specific endonuclease VapC